MNSVYRFRKGRHFAKPPEAIWPFVADSARINEMVGFPPYRVEERLGADGRIRRIASGRLGPLRLNWEETFGEWQENRRVVQRRQFLNGPIGYFVACAELEPEGTGSRSGTPRLISSCLISAADRYTISVCRKAVTSPCPGGALPRAHSGQMEFVKAVTHQRFFAVRTANPILNPSHPPFGRWWAGSSSVGERCLSSLSP
jgi:hypothetical protein